MWNMTPGNPYSKPDAIKINSLLERELCNDDTKLVVLDDDPTGTQTVHDISVYTDWTEKSIRAGFAEQKKLFYVLTNSRSLTAEQTKEAHREIGDVIASVSKETGKRCLLFSRSDSTLRGHYPLETEILKETMEAHGLSVDGEILCPFFQEGGRVTIGNVHYVKYGNELVPAAETEFAKDRTFGYENSSLPEYIEEKTKGKYKAEDVICISLESLRGMELDEITRQLESVANFQKVCVNAVDYLDLKVFCIALYRAMQKGKTFLFRTAASLVKTMGGIPDKKLLTRSEMLPNETKNGGLVMVGSHTQKTTAQLRELETLDCVVPIEFHSELVLAGEEVFQKEIARCVAKEEEAIRSGKTAVCFTSRTLLTEHDDTPEKALLRSVKISDGVQSLVSRLRVTPAFVVAKGGITSADVAVKALKIRRATVLGQIRPGVPVWKCAMKASFRASPM